MRCRFQAVAWEGKLDLNLAGPVAVVRGDPTMLERIVSNLVDNAVKHTPRDGMIEIIITAGDPTALTVRDSGPGVAAVDQPHLFNRFFRGEPTTAHADSTGLGLAIAKAAAEAHGGQLEFVGNDPGAVFRLVLPGQVTNEGDVMVP